MVHAGRVLSQVSLGDLPTWVASVGTVGAVWVALFQIRTERRRRHEREEQDRVERHRAQARLVSAVMGPEERVPDDDVGGRTGVDLINASAEPVYSLVVGIVFVQGAGPGSIEGMLGLRKDEDWPPRPVPVTTASILPGGTYRVWIGGTGWSRILSGRSGAEVAFTDRAGSHWVRRAMGQLEELDQEPFAYFTQRGLFSPYELQTPERLG